MAWCKARMKLAYSVMIDLNSRSVNYFYAHFAAKTWHPCGKLSQLFFPSPTNRSGRGAGILTNQLESI